LATAYEVAANVHDVDPGASVDVPTAHMLHDVFDVPVE